MGGRRNQARVAADRPPLSAPAVAQRSATLGRLLEPNVPMRPAFSPLLLIGAALLAGCASAPVATVTAPAPAATVASQDLPADDSLNATVWFQTSVERDLVYTAIYRAAGQRLDAALRDKQWDALPKEERSNDATRLPPAIIVDIDETVLDNSPSTVRQIREHRGFNEAAWGEWVNERLRTCARSVSPSKTMVSSLAWAPSSKVANSTVRRRVAAASWSRASTAC